ncbi:uncharacterized protein LOC110441801 [Mizuhopecten yessoensis]|uniref:uncharacterized protein LOC110441801 n=1 Tax=Mizuhopecten yessoensis TaxID=6573 RepID=UPI000B45991D|nr:uncharacterized protein LOC110441801 [Mizuhopecten yessoensis]
MTDPENQQHSEDITGRGSGGGGKQQQNIEVNVEIKENGSFHDNCTKGDNDEHIPSSSRVKGAGNTDDDPGRNIVSRMQNYCDMPTVNGNAMAVHSVDITVHNMPVNHQIEAPSIAGECSTNNGNQHKQLNDPQPSSSSGQLESRQMSSIDSTITVVPETEDNPAKKNTEYIEETWEHSKARRYRRRAIFCTDTYNNMGDMAREKELSEALSSMKDRWSRRPKLDRQLSDVVLTKKPMLEEILSEQKDTNKTDNDISTINGDVSIEEHDKECKQRPKKLTMKDVYKELRLMRQVVAASVRTDSSVVREHQDKTVSIASPSEIDIEKKEENDDPEIENATGNTSDTCDTNESDPPPSDIETPKTEENAETTFESQDSNRDQEDEEMTTVRQLSNMDIEHDDGTQNTEDDNGSNMTIGQCDDSTNDQSEHTVEFD